MAGLPGGKRERNKAAARAAVLRGAVALFLEQGYHRTTTAQIAERIGHTEASVFRAFRDKEEILYTLVGHMFGSQFEKTRALLGAAADELLVYGVETALQLHICELSEPLRDLYVTAYTLETTSDLIFKSTAKELERIFSPYLPQATQSDFYEMEIASGALMRGYMAKKCDIYFPIERKLRLFLDCALKLYDVPVETRERVIAQVLTLDMAAMAKHTVAETVRMAEGGTLAKEDAT